MDRPPGAKTGMTSLATEGRDREEGMQCEPEQGAATAEERGGKGELREEGGHVGSGVPGLMGDRNHGDGGASGGSGQQFPQQEQLVPKGAEGSVQPAERPRPLERTRFTQSQLQELEGVFQRNHYPNAATRRELGRRMGVPEARVQIWFKNRRTRWRRCQRAPRVRYVPFMCLGYPVTVISVGLYNMLFVNPNGMWILLEPLPPLWQLGRSRLRRPIFQYPFLLPVPFLLPSLFPFGPASLRVVPFLITDVYEVPVF